MRRGGVELHDDLALHLLRLVRIHIIAVAGGLAFFGADDLLGLGGEFVDLFGGEVAAGFEDLALFFGEGVGFDGGTAFEALGLAGLELLDLFGDADGAPVVAAHGAEVGVDIEILVVVGAGGVLVEGELEVLVPVEGGAGLGELVVPVAGAGDAQGDIGGVCGDLVGDAAFFDIALLGEAEVLLGGDIAEHGGAVVGDGGGADAGGDVVVAGEDIGDERAEDIEGCAVADGALELGVVFDLVEGDMAGAFDHDLDTASPGAFGELADDLEFAELGEVGGVGEPAGSEPVADGEGDIVLAHEVADVVPEGVHDVVLVVDEHPLGEERAASGDDADGALLDIFEVGHADAGVDGEVVDALFGLVLEGFHDEVAIEVFDLLADDHGVDGDGADGDRGVFEDGGAGCVEVASGGEVHDGVGAPALGPLELFDFFVGA